jgi:ArsR family transcriptional regulator
MEQTNYAKIFKALSNEQRLNIFMMIYKNCCGIEGNIPLDSQSCCGVKGSVERAFSKVCDCMKLSRSTISHHFKELQNAGLIKCTREGQTFRCSVNEEAVEAIKNFLS